MRAFIATRASASSTAITDDALFHSDTRHKAEWHHKLR